MSPADGARPFHSSEEARRVVRCTRAMTAMVSMHYMRPGTWSHRVGAMPVSFGRPLLRLDPERT